MASKIDGSCAAAVDAARRTNGASADITGRSIAPRIASASALARPSLRVRTACSSIITWVLIPRRLPDQETLPGHVPASPGHRHRIGTQERSCRGTSSPAGPQALVLELRTRPPAPAAGAGQPGREHHEIFSSHLPPFPFLIDARVLPESFGEVLVHRLPPLQRPDPSAPKRLVISHDRQICHTTSEIGRAH